MGYHLFRLEERQDGTKHAFEEVREQIFAFLFQKKSDELFQDWMNQLKDQAYISVR
jgi:peptidyl-prolyl cis-trans isomerase SurA